MVKKSNLGKNEKLKKFVGINLEVEKMPNGGPCWKNLGT